MRRSIVFLVLLGLFLLSISTPQACSGSSEGNAVLSVSDDDDVFDDKVPLPAYERFMFNPNTPEKLIYQPTAPQNGLPIISPQDTGSPLIPKSAFNEADAKKLVKSKGLKYFKVGNIEIAELDEKMSEQCLTKFQFCSISCSHDFSMSCPQEAKIFSVFVTREQHADLCVRPRVLKYRNNFHESKAAATHERHQCILRPCSCKIYEQIFIREYGAEQYHQALKFLQKKCHSWCKTGKVPSGITTEKEANAAIKKNEKMMLEMYEKLFPFLKYFVEYGRMVKTAFEDGYKYTKYGAIWLGNNIVKEAKVVGKNIVKGANIVKNNVVKEANIVKNKVVQGANIVKNNVVKGANIVKNNFVNGANIIKNKVQNGFRNTFRRAGGFFRGGFRRVGGAFRRAGGFFRRAGGFFRRAGGFFRRW